MAQEKYNFLFIPGGGVTAAVSQSIVDEYSRLLGQEITLIPYPEFVTDNFRINIKNYQEYFRKIVFGQKKDLPIIIIGFSLGAYFALYVASLAKNQIKSVILISPFIKKPSNYIFFIFSRIKSWIEEQGAHADFYHYPGIKVIKDLLIFRKEIISQLTNVIFELKFDKNLRESDVKKYIIIGNKDCVLPKYTAEDLGMKNSKTIFIDGGHDILTNKNKRLIPVLRDILGSIEL